MHRALLVVGAKLPWSTFVRPASAPLRFMGWPALNLSRMGAPSATEFHFATMSSPRAGLSEANEELRRQVAELARRVDKAEARADKAARAKEAAEARAKEAVEARAKEAAKANPPTLRQCLENTLGIDVSQFDTLHLGNGVGFKFDQVIGRDRVVREMHTAVAADLGHVGTVDKGQVTLHKFISGPGTGKSRFLQDAAALVEQHRAPDAPRFLPIRVSFYLQPLDDASLQSHAVEVGLRMAHSLWAPGVTWAVWRARVAPHVALFTASAVMELVPADRIPFVVLDELNSVHAGGDRFGDEMIKRVLDEARSRRAVVVAAAASLNLERVAIDATDYRTRDYELELLTHEEGVELVRAELNHESLSPTMELFVRLAGPIPRALEMLVEAAHAEEDDYARAWAQLSSRFKERYSNWVWQENAAVRRRFVRLSLLRVPTSPVDASRADLLAFSVPCDEHGVLHVPYLWAEDGLGEVKRVMPPGSAMHWHHYEQMVCAHLALKLKLWAEEKAYRGEGTNIALGELVPEEAHWGVGVDGATSFQAAASTRYVGEAAAHFPASAAPAWDDGHVRLNMAGAPADGWVVLHRGDTEKLVLFVQCKAVREWAGVNLDEERRKVAESMHGRSEPWVLLCVVTADKPAAVRVPADVIVVDRSAFEAYFSSTLCAVVEATASCLTTHVDVATCDEASLTRLYGVGKSRHRELVEKREALRRSVVHESVVRRELREWLETKLTPGQWRKCMVQLGGGVE